MKANTCCFFGHREIEETEELKSRLLALTENLIAEKGVDTFLFGSKSRFNSLCYETVTRLKEKYPHVKRVYVRAEYRDIDDKYNSYLLKRYEETYYPERIAGAGKAVYIERNYEMINRSRYCIVYFDENIKYKNRKSGTKAAFECAVKKGVSVFNVFSLF